MTDDDRRLADRLRAYESRVPAPDDVHPAVRPRRVSIAALGAATGVLAVAIIAGTGVLWNQPTTGAASPTPISAPTRAPTAEPSLAPTSTPAPIPMTAPPGTPEPTAEPTPTARAGPIARWATAAAFGREGFAEEVRDIARATGNFIAIGMREPLEARGQVGPYQHEPLIWVSPDGRAWESVPLGSEFVGASLGSIVALPDGDAAIYGVVDRDPDPYMQDVELSAAWRSSDGRHWQRFDIVLPADTENWEPALESPVEAGPRGYLARSTFADDRGLVSELWYSEDGVAWEVVRRFEPDGTGWTEHLRDYEAGAEGFVLTGQRYETESDDRVYEPFVMASAAGREWLEADPSTVPQAPDLLVAPVGGDWILTATDSAAGTDTTWFSTNGLAWEERAAIDVPDPAPPADWGDTWSVIGTVIPADDRAFVIGAVGYCCHGPWWAAGIWSSFDGRSWERLGFPDDAVVSAAAWHDGVTVLGGHTGASPDAAWQARATFWVGER